MKKLLRKLYSLTIPTMTKVEINHFEAADKKYLLNRAKENIVLLSEKPERLQAREVQTTIFLLTLWYAKQVSEDAVRATPNTSENTQVRSRGRNTTKTDGKT